MGLHLSKAFYIYFLPGEVRWPETLSDMLKVTQQVTGGARLEPHSLIPAMVLHKLTLMQFLFLVGKLYGSFQSQANL